MTTYTVTTDLDEAFDGGTLADEMNDGFGLSLREAVALAEIAASDDIIDFDSALAGGTLFLTSGELSVSAGGFLTIDGDTDGDGKADIAISGNDASRIIAFNAVTQTLSLESLTLKDGNAGLLSGGAVYTGSTSSLRVLNSTISDNTAGTSGGGIFAWIDAHIANSTIADNEAGRGGGIATSSASSLTLTNTTVHGNYADNIGGGVYMGSDSNLTISSSTITENESATNGGALAAFAGSTLTIENSVLADNINPSVGTPFASLAGSSTVNAGNSFFDDTASRFSVDSDLGGNIFDQGGDPGLGPLADNGGVVQTQAIQDGSPLLEAGSPARLPTETDIGLDVDGDGTVEATAISVDARGAGFDRDVDFDGNPPTPDIGAFEAQLVSTFVVTTNLDEEFNGGDLTTEMTDGFGLSLREALGLANLDPASIDTITFDANEFTGGADSLIRLDALLGELVNSGMVTIDGSTGTDVVITGDTGNDDTLVTGTYITDVDASLADMADNVRVLNITSPIATTELNALTITGGYTNVADTIADYAGRGAGISTYAALTVTNSTVAGNYAAGDDSVGKTVGGGIGFANNVYNAPTITIADSEITGNRVFGEGGGVGHSDGDIVITDSTISNNTAFGYDAEGGGLRTTGGDVTVTDSFVTGNRAVGIADAALSSRLDAEGGAIRSSSGTITVTGSVFSGNSVEIVGQSTTGFAEAEGGAIRSSSGDVTVIDSVLHGNVVTAENNTIGGGLDAEGGAIRTSGGDITIVNSTVAGNAIDTGAGNTVTEVSDIHGGGLRTNGGTIALTNATVTGNYSGGEGGGIAVAGSSGALTLANSIILGNGAAGSDDEVFLFTGATQTETAPSLVGTTLHDGLGGTTVLPGSVQDVAQATFADTTGFVDLNADGGKQSGEPSLGTDIRGGAVRDNGGDVPTVALLSGGPAIDAGDQTQALDDMGAPLTTDARGVGADRVVGAEVDLGAFEQQDGGSFVVTTNIDEAFDGGDLAAEMADGEGLSLREALGLANIAPEAADTITFDANEFTGGADSLIRLDAALGELVNSGIVTIDGSTGTDVVITGDTAGDDALVGSGYITDVDASNGNLADNVRVLNIKGGDATTTLHSLTITGGHTTGVGYIEDGNDGNGGGIRTNAELTIVNSTISGNSTAGKDAGGGGIGNSQHDANGYIGSDDVGITIVDSTISGNRAFGDGGGVTNGDAAITVLNSTITDNIATGYTSDGGGIHTTGGTIIVANSDISDNHVVGEANGETLIDAEGGGIHNSGGDTFITGSTISGNSVTVEGQTTSEKIDAEGGGIRTSSGDLFITNSSITGNFVRVENNTVGTHLDVEGGGIRSYEGVVNIVNSTIAGNAILADGNTVTDTTDIEGGGLRSDTGNVSITNTTITGNYSSGAGGGVFIKNGPYGIPSFYAANSLVLGNGAGDGSPTNEIALNGSNFYDGLPAIIGSTLYDGLGSGSSTVLPGTIADIAQSVFNQTIDFVDLNGDGSQQPDEPSLGADIEGGLTADDGDGAVALLEPDLNNPALDAGEDVVSINTILDETFIGVDMNGDGDATDIMDDIGDFSFDQRGDGFDRLFDQTSVANNGANTIDLGAVEIQREVMPNRAPVELSLIDTDTDQLITIIRDGDDVPLSLVQGRNVTLSATVPNTSPLFGQVESMFLNFNGGEATRGETVEPYALFGDDTAGDFFDGTMLELGGQSLVLDLFSDDARNNLLSTVEFNFTVTDGPNASPVITSDNGNAVDENQTFAIDVQSTDDSDSEGSGLTYSLDGGADESAFSIDPVTGVLTFNSAPDFENPTDADTDNVYEVDVLVTDSGNESTSQSINVTVEDVDETVPPVVELALIDTDTDTVLTIVEDGDDVPLSLVQGRNVTLSATVPNTSPLFGQVESMFLNFNSGEATRGETVEPYALFGDDTAGDFFDGTMLDLGGQSLVLELFSDNGRNNLLETVEINFTVTDGPNASPVITSDNGNAVDENQTFAIDVQSTDDRDSEGSGLTYSLDGGADETAFSIDPVTGVLTFNAAPDFENPTDANTDNVYEVDVLVTDSGNESASQSITITVEDVFEAPNAPPQFTSPNSASVDENHGSTVIDLEATDDSDSEGSGLRYFLNGGPDESAFVINPITGTIGFLDAPDFENPTDANGDNIYEFGVRVEDSEGLSATETLTVTVEDVDETVQSLAEVGIYDTDTNALVTLIEDGDVFPVGLFNGNEDDLTIGVVIPNSSPLFGQVESVFLDLNDGQVTRTENAELYTLNGDFNGDLFDGQDLTGDNTIALEFYSNNQRGGDLLGTLELDFSIDDLFGPS